MLDQQDPWLAIGDPVDHDPAHTPRIPAQSGNTQSPAQVAPPQDEFAQIGQPVQPGDQSTTTADQMEGGFADSHPDTPKSRLSPEDEAHYAELLHTGTAADINRFLASKGRSTDQDWLGKFLSARDDRKKHGGRVNYSISYAYPDPAQIPHDASVDPNSGLTAATHGALENVPGLNHAAAFGRALDNSILGRSGDRSLGQEYNYQDDLQHGQVANEEENHPYLRVGGQLLGGLAIPAGLEGVGLKAGTDVLRAGGSMADARAAVKVAVRNRSAIMGGSYGAAHGAGNADTPGEALTGALTEGALGAATGGALGQIAPTSKAAAEAGRIVPPTEAQNAVSTFDRGEVDPLLAYVGGTGAQMASGVTHMTLGGIPLATAAQKTIEQAKAFRDRIANGMGYVRDSMGAGRSAQRGADAFVDRTGGRAKELYDAIPITGDRPATLTGTKAALADVNAGLSSNEELSALIQDPRMMAFQKAITGSKEEMPTGLLDAEGKPIMRTVQKGGSLSWQDLKAFRTYVGEKLNGLTFQNDTSQGALKRLYSGLSSDMEASARAQGPEALAKFQRANSYFRARQTRLEQVIKPILGDKGDGGPQAAFNQIQSWATHKGETVKVAQLMRSLPDDEAGTVRATLFSRLGNANPGAQNAADNAFSPTTFATHWANMDPRAKSAIFSPEHRRDIDDLVEIAHRMKDSAKYANNSKTSLGLNAGAHASAAWTAVASFNPLALFATGGVIGTEIGAGHLLASPRFARWMVGMAKKPNPAARLAHIQRLTSVARAEPAIANEVFHLQQRLAEAFTSTPTRLAAQEPANKADGGQGNAGEQQPQNESPAAAAPTTPPADDKGYHDWLNKYGIREDPTYDTRAAYQSGLKPDSRGHLNDEYKLPNHPTFSDESIHNGEGGKQGGKWVQTAPASSGMSEGTWTFKASPWNLQNMSKQHLKEYFDRVEPGMTIIFPDGEHYTGKDSRK